MSGSYSHINFRTETALRYRKFSKQITPTYSSTLDTMMDFFEINQLSPHEVLGPNMKKLENRLQKRIHAVVAIIRDMEKHQTKPTVAMLQSLFESNSPTPTRKTEKKLWREKKGIPPKKEEKNTNLQLEEAREELEYYKDRCARMEKAYSTARADLEKVLGHVKTIRPPLAKPYLRLELSPEMITHLKSKFNLN